MEYTFSGAYAETPPCAMIVGVVGAFQLGVDMGDAVAGKVGIGGWGFNLDALDAIAGRVGIGTVCFACS